MLELLLNKSCRWRGYMTVAVAEWLLEDPTHSHEVLEKIMVKYGETPAPELLSVVSEEITSRIKEWRNEAGEPFEYLWFNVNDFESIELIKLLRLMKICERIAYKTFEK